MLQTAILPKSLKTLKLFAKLLCSCSRSWSLKVFTPERVYLIFTILRKFLWSMCCEQLWRFPTVSLSLLYLYIDPPLISHFISFSKSLLAHLLAHLLANMLAFCAFNFWFVKIRDGNDGKCRIRTMIAGHPTGTNTDNIQVLGKIARLLGRSNLVVHWL